MFIVHVVRQFHPSVGGLENHVLDLAAAQVAAGNRVRVVTLDRLFNSGDQKTLPAREDLDGIEIVRVSYVGSSRYPIAPSAIRHIMQADVVHVHAIDFFFDYLAWTAPIHRRKLVVTTHGGFFHTPYATLLKRIWFSTITRLSSKFYAAVIACSAQDFERFRQLRHPHLTMIEDGVNTSKFRDAAARTFRKSIVSIGRFSQNKRVDLLVQFMRALTQQDPDWKLTIVGRPDDLQVSDVTALIEAAGLANSVEVVASPDDETLRRVIGNSSFLASASDYEGFGMTAVEGMSAGLFPLLSDIPPFRRLVDRTGMGLLLDYKEPDQAVRGLLQNVAQITSLYDENRTASIRAAANYDWSSVSQKVADLYAAVSQTEPAIADVPRQAQPSTRH